VAINLKAYAINASHRITASIRKTPLADSSLSVDFVYMPYEGEGEGLVSLQRAEELEHRRHLREITEEHEKLVFHNSRLSEEIRKLKEKNADLSSQRHSLQQSISQREQQFTSEIQSMEKEKERSLTSLQD
jgi:predicted RNase H-like nuclease (RuvC/YqgF family)